MKKAFLLLVTLFTLATSVSAQVNFNTTIKDVCSSNDNNGAIYITPTQGTPPFTYTWSGPQSGTGTSDTISGLSAGTYSVTAQDANLGTRVKTLIVEAKYSLQIDSTTYNSVCDGNIELYANAQGNDYPQSYLWSDGTTNYETTTSLSNTDFTVTATYADGCVLTATRNTGNIQVVDLDLTNAFASCLNGLDIEPFLIGASDPNLVQYQITGLFYGLYQPLQTNPNFYGLPSDLYQIVGLDPVTGCVNVDTLPGSIASITNDQFDVEVDTVSEPCSGAVKFTVTVWDNAFNNKTNDVDIYWSVNYNNVGNGSVYYLTEPTNNLELAIETEYECVQYFYYHVTQMPDGFTASTSSTPASCSNDGSVSANIDYGDTTVAYLWSTGDTTATVNNLPAGSYTVTITDVSGSGCADTLTATIGSVGSSLVVDSITTIRSTCATSPNGNISLYASSSSLPISYAWSSADTNSTATGLTAGTYTVTITDAGGCSNIQTIQLLSTGLQVEVLVDTPVNCISGVRGSLKASPLNGTPPYNFIWNTGGTNDTINNLTVGGYTVTVTDANLCSTTVHFRFDPDPACFTSLSGRVYVDMDSSCSFNSGDIGLAGKTVKIDPGFTAITNSTGHWQANVVKGQQYAISVPPGAPIQLDDACGVDTLLVNVPNNTSIPNLDIPKFAPAVADVSVNLNSSALRPGFNIQNYVNICNEGYTTENVTGSIVLDSNFVIQPTVNGGNVTIDSVSSTVPYTIYFSYNSLAPQSCEPFNFTSTLATLPTINIGQVLTSVATVVNNGGGDVDTTNNTVVYSRSVTGAYDPNDKRLFSDGVEISGIAEPNDTILEYVIRFQNTGNDTAFNVQIRDTLDGLIDPSTFRLLNTSHPVDIQFYEDRIIHFDFYNILLPDSNVNEPLSHGLVTFEIELINPDSLQAVSNQAAIYFDFNPPIYTNTVTTARAERPVVFGNNSICTGDTIVLSSSLLPEFTYYWTKNGNSIPNATGSTIEVTDGGDYQIHLVFGDAQLSSAPFNVTANALPTATLSAANNTLCENATAVSINVSPTGGVLTGDGVTGTSFDPATAGVGAHQLTYEYTDGNNCSATAYETVTVNASPTATLNAASNSLCEDATAISIAVSPAGGTLTGDGVTGTSFDPAMAGVGAHQLTYEYTDGNNCSATAYETVTVNASPTATLNAASNSLCEDASAISLNVSPAGGTLTGDGVSGTSFDPATAGVGAHQLTYEYTDGNNCAANAYETVTVNANPTANLSAASNSLCEDATAVSLTLSPSGGVLTGDGVSGTSFYPATAGAGTHQLTYEYTDGNNCSATAYETVTVNASPTATLTAASNSLCEDATAISIAVSPAGGTLTGDGVTGTSFDPATAGVGAHQLTYEYTDGNNCSATAYETVTVNANPTATLSAASNSLCEDASAISITVSPTGGTLTGDGVSGTSFDPAMAGVGAHQLTYEYTDGNNCSATAYETVTVNASPTATLNAASNSLCEDASAISLNVSPAGGTLTGDGVSGTSFDPATAGVGAHQLTYVYTDGNNCAATAYETVTVNANPTASFSLPSDPLCEDDQALDISGYVSPAGGVIAGTGVSGTSLDISTAGNYSLTYTYTDNNGCAATAQASAVVEVCIGIEDTELPVASIHPNPTNGLVTISVDGKPIDQVILMDVTGKQVQIRPMLTIGSATLYLDDLASGMYMLHILSEGNWYTERLVLQH